jgi:hypothetical protein
VDIHLLMAAWLEPGPLGCAGLMCVDPDRRRRAISRLDPDLDLEALDAMRAHRFGGQDVPDGAARRRH